MWVQESFAKSVLGRVTRSGWSFNHQGTPGTHNQRLKGNRLEPIQSVAHKIIHHILPTNNHKQLVPPRIHHDSCKLVGAEAALKRSTKCAYKLVYTRNGELGTQGLADPYPDPPCQKPVLKAPEKS